MSITLLLAIVPLAAFAPSQEKLRVLTTTPELRDIAAQIGGDLVEATSLLRGPEDPHFADAKPSAVKAANRADLFIKDGMSLEIGYEPQIVTSSRNPKIQPGTPGYLDASATIPKLEVPTGVVDRSLGDVHPEGNPHYLLDPVNGKRVASAIRDALVALLPEKRGAIEERAAAFSRRIDEAMFGAKILERFKAQTLEELLASGGLADFLKKRDAETDLGGWAAAMRPAAGKPIVVFHRNVAYFAERFRLPIVAAIEPKPGVPPSSSHLASVIATMRAQQVRAVFFTVFQNRAAVDKVCAETGATPVLFPHQVDAVPEASSYVAWIDAIVKAATSALARS
jgi:zinc/manganese transport system substrate-binding protein